jgi:predicted metal-dependent peptidase
MSASSHPSSACVSTLRTGPIARGELRDQLGAARAWLLLRHPCFGRLAMRLRFVPSRELPTAAIRADETCLANPEFIAGLDLPGRAFVVAHEVLHLGLGHFDRLGARRPRLWNLAGDYAINGLLRRGGLPAPEIRGLSFADDPEFDQLSDVEIYEVLTSRGDAAESVRDATLPLGIGTYGGDCDFASTGDLRRAAETGTGWRVPAAAEWQDELVAALEHAGGRGAAPSGLERWVVPPAKAVMPWQRLLSRMLKSRSGASYRNPSRRSAALRRVLSSPGGARTVLPGTVSNRAPLAVAVDTSGSMSRRMLEQCLGEIRAIAAVHQAPIRLLACDAQVHMDVEYRGQAIALPGGGGSSTLPVFHRLLTTKPMPRLLVYFSDLHVAYPSAPPPFPVVWISTGDAFGPKVPFGRLVVLSPPSARDVTMCDSAPYER